jgi:hypothetical protein
MMLGVSQEKQRTSVRVRRAEGTKDYEGKESKSPRGVEISVLAILNLLLLNKTRVFNLALVPTLS